MPDNAPPESGTWTLDPAHSTIEFVARHLMVTKVRGGFASIEGTVEIADEPTESTVSINIDTTSITTGVADRDGHLKSPDFFDVENFPTMKFVSTSVVDTGSGYAMTGNLTVKDVTRSLVLDVDYLGTIADPWGNSKAAFSASAEVDREDWDLTWNTALEAGGFLVSKTARIEIEAQLIKNTPDEAAE